MPEPRLRGKVVTGDLQAVRALCVSAGNFSAGEVDVAVELVAERLTKGEDSGYRFLFAEQGQATQGYACYGPIPLTQKSWDLYWIAVLAENQGHGLGGRLLAEVEKDVQRWGGTALYVDTSSRPDYEPTRGFYLKHGYEEAARLPGFYAPGDDKVVYRKILGP